eukprot:TRINITY_DN5267_c0_g1_i1.p1 TRINITY_DN5267_c0_g1~~TRINITY_DN5267_c0_g1_i1.p1  ORF type:complete len:313 (-),score=114.67 TRINITY_DN5267_c0_g1_i1:113-1051(-)
MSNSQTFNTFQEFFESIHVENLKTKDVVSISSKETLEEGFNKLAINNILSAPVFDEVEKKYVGFLDMRDLVSSVVFIATHSTSWEETKTLKDLIVKAKWTEGSYTVTYLARRNKYVPVKVGSSLFEVVKLMGNSKVKRVPIVDEHGKIISIISQSTIINLVTQNIKRILDPKLKQSIHDLGLGNKPVVSVNKTAKTIDVFGLMDKHSFSGIAFVDNEGRLVGNISSRDIKAFVKQIDFHLLVSPVGEFIKHLRETDVNITHPTINCFDKNAFSFVIEKISATKVHRIFVVDGEEHFRPSIVVSLQDVLSKFL